MLVLGDPPREEDDGLVVGNCELMPDLSTGDRVGLHSLAVDVRIAHLDAVGLRAPLRQPRSQV